MIDFKARGYVKYLEQKNTSTGKAMTTFQISFKQKRKGKSGEPLEEYVNIRCRGFSPDGEDLLEEGLYLEMEGYMNVYLGEYKGSPQIQFDAVVKKVMVAPPKKEWVPPTKAATAPKRAIRAAAKVPDAPDPFGDASDDLDGIPF